MLIFIILNNVSRYLFSHISTWGSMPDHSIKVTEQSITMTEYKKNKSANLHNMESNAWSRDSQHQTSEFRSDWTFGGFRRKKFVWVSLLIYLKSKIFHFTLKIINFKKYGGEILKLKNKDFWLGESGGQGNYYSRKQLPLLNCYLYILDDWRVELSIEGVVRMGFSWFRFEQVLDPTTNILNKSVTLKPPSKFKNT